MKSNEHGACPSIRNALEQLAGDLGHFEQTTHGCLGPFSIESVAEALVDCYQDPRAFTVSDLSQKINGFLKSERHATRQT